MRFTRRRGEHNTAISILSPYSSHTWQVTHLESSPAFFHLSSACLVHPAAGPSEQGSALPTCSAKATSCRHHCTVSNEEDLHRGPSEGHIMPHLSCSCRHTKGSCLSLAMYQITEQMHTLRVAVAVSSTQSRAVK